MQRVGVARRQRSRLARRRAAARRSRRCVTPAAIAAHRARSTIGTMPPCLRSSWPRLLAAVLDDEAAEEAGRRAVREREAGQHAQQAGVLGARRKVSATGVPVWTPHTGRLSTSTETRIRALLLGRIRHPAAGRPAARTPRERTNARRRALTPCSSGAARTRAALRSPRGARSQQLGARISCVARRAAPNHTIALSTSELGSASRRAWLPERQPRELGAGARRDRPTASSSSRRVSASTTTEYTRPSRCAAATRASCSATTIGRSSRATVSESSTLRAAAIRWRR